MCGLMIFDVYLETALLGHVESINLCRPRPAWTAVQLIVVAGERVQIE